MVMNRWVLKPSFLLILSPTKYRENDANVVDVSDLASDLKHAPKICGSDLVHFHILQLSIKQVHTTRLLLHWQIDYDASTSIGLVIRSPMR